MTKFHKYFVSLMFIFVNSSFANYLPTRVFFYDYPPHPMPHVSTVRQACQDWADYRFSTNGGTHEVIVFVSETEFYCTYQDGYSPNISTLSECLLGDTFNGTECVPQSPCVSKASTSAGKHFYGVDSGTTLCDGQCEITRIPPISDSFYFSGSCLTPTGNPILNGSITNVVTIGCYYSSTYNGNSCTINNLPTPPSPSTPNTQQDCLASGGSWGQVNGNNVCAPNSNSTSQTTTTTTAPNGTTSTGQESTTTSTTANSDGTFTKTTTKIHSDGSTTTTSTTQDKQSFCEQNPTLQICKASHFSGSCTTAFICDGDAVQCAIAKKQHNDRCNDEKTDSTSDLGADLISRTINTDNPLNGSTLQAIYLPTTINGASLLPKTGLNDQNFPLGGHSFTLKFSSLNTPLSFAGKFVLIISYLISAMIIFGRRNG